MNLSTSRPQGPDSPTAAISTLKQRARLLAEIRGFFDRAGYFEVETPLISAETIVDAWLEPFVTHWLPMSTEWNCGGQPRYLQTSPEFAMKRLLAAGADSIYQLGKVFRNGEFGRRHNPEFTMLEWYRRGDDLTALMNFTEDLVRHVLAAGAELLQQNCQPQQSTCVHRATQAPAFERITYRDAFYRVTGRCVLTCGVSDLHSIAGDHQLVPPRGLHVEDRDGWLNLLLAELIEPGLGRERPTFLTNYPASQGALAQLSADGLTAERFELYIDGVELCNGYHELTDPVILRNRIATQAAIRDQAGLRPLPIHSRLLVAMDAGLPNCAGNALGVDRLVMLALGKDELAQVIPFPFDIA